MKVTIKKSKVSTALLKKLEAAGIVVTLIISSAAGATEACDVQLPNQVFAVCAGIEDENADRPDIGEAYERAQAELDLLTKQMRLERLELQIDDVCDL